MEMRSLSKDILGDLTTYTSELNDRFSDGGSQTSAPTSPEEPRRPPTPMRNAHKAIQQRKVDELFAKLQLGDEEADNLRDQVRPRLTPRLTRGPRPRPRPRLLPFPPQQLPHVVPRLHARIKSNRQARDEDGAVDQQKLLEVLRSMPGQHENGSRERSRSRSRPAGFGASSGRGLSPARRPTPSMPKRPKAPVRTARAGYWSSMRRRWSAYQLAHAKTSHARTSS